MTSDRDIEHEEAMEAVETNDKNEIKNKCHKCDFIGKTEAGLKVHKTAMHKSIFKMYTRVKQNRRYKQI